MKYEWRKEEKKVYGIKKEPVILNIPEQSYIAICGKGNPNEPDFSERVGVLYSLAYGIKMLYKKKCKESGKTCFFEDYVVYPLEGVWSSTSEDPKDKNAFMYTIMIKQPDWITKEIFEEAYETVSMKKPHPFLKEVQFKKIEDGLCVQLLHAGSYDDEPASFAHMDAFIEKQGYQRIEKDHREIYLTNATRTAPEKQKTILRYKIAKR